MHINGIRSSEHVTYYKPRLQKCSEYIFVLMLLKETLKLTPFVMLISKFLHTCIDLREIL